MSPEQAIGDLVDARSDVFSFGVIFYEMLAGRRPFDGKTLSDVLQQLHLSEPPPLGQLRPDTPVRLHEIVDAVPPEEAGRSILHPHRSARGARRRHHHRPPTS